MVGYTINLPHIYSKSGCPTGSCVECLEAESIRSKLLAAIEEVKTLSSALCDQQKMVNRAHSNIIRSLPVEITSHVFGYYISVGEFCEVKDYWLDMQRPKSCIRPRFKLGSICTAWREISRSTPYLWKDLVLCLSSSTSSDHVELVEEWIELGKTAGLRLHLTEKTEKTSVKFQTVLDVMQPIISSSAYLEEVNLILYHRLLFYVTSLFRDLTNVQSIGIQCENWDSTEELELWTNATQASPEQISFIRITPACANINWKNVTHATLHTVSVEACLEMLRVASNLESCWLGRPFYQGDIDSLTMVTHSKIRHFKYSEQSWEWPTIFSLLSFPNLVDLTASDFWDFKEDFHVKEIQAFVSRSPSASTFILDSCYMPTDLDRVINWFRLMQSFSHLHLYDINHHSGFFEALAKVGMPINSEQPMDEILMPHIQEIIITTKFIESYIFTWEKLLAPFASPSSRFRSGSKPISFELCVMSRVHKDYGIPPISVLNELVAITKEAKNIKFRNVPKPRNRYDLLAVWEKCYK